jgi:hypothetical protein
MALGKLALGGSYTRLSQGLFTEAVFVDTQTPDSRFERRTGNSKFDGRTGRTGNLPPTLRQSRFNHFFFPVREGVLLHLQFRYAASTLDQISREEMPKL